MSVWQWAGLAWGSWFLAFVVLELLAATGHAPWPTLSATAWRLEQAWSWAPIVFLAGLSVLLVHIVFRFPNRQWQQRRKERP